MVWLMDVAGLSNLFPALLVPLLFLGSRFRERYVRRLWRNALILGLAFGAVRAGMAVWAYTQVGYPLNLYFLLTECAALGGLDAVGLIDTYARSDADRGAVAAVLVTGPLFYTALFLTISSAVHLVTRRGGPAAGRQ